MLNRALTHSSANAALSNERLEFFGDRVLGLIAAEKLHALYPADAEGAFWAKAMLRISDTATDAIRNFFIEMFFK